MYFNKLINSNFNELKFVDQNYDKRIEGLENNVQKT